MESYLVKHRGNLTFTVVEIYTRGNYVQK